MGSGCFSWLAVSPTTLSLASSRKIGRTKRLKLNSVVLLLVYNTYICDLLLVATDGAEGARAAEEGG